jgi:hypothetical protein
MLWLFALSAADLASAGDAPKAADKATEAAATRQAAVGAYDSGAFGPAAEQFEKLYQLTADPVSLFNAAASWDAAKEFPRAADEYEAVLALGGLEARYVQLSRERLNVLKASLGYVEITGPARATVSAAHVQDRVLPASFHLAPGTHELTVRDATGRSMQKALVLRAGDTASVNFPAEPPRPQGVRAATASQPRAAARREETPEAAATVNPWPWVALGAASAFAIVGTSLLLEAKQRSDDYDAKLQTYETRPTESGFQDLDEARDRWVVVTGVIVGAYALTAIAGTTAIVLWATDSSSGEINAAGFRTAGRF